MPRLTWNDTYISRVGGFPFFFPLQGSFCVIPRLVLVPVPDITILPLIIQLSASSVDFRSSPFPSSIMANHQSPPDPTPLSTLSELPSDLQWEPGSQAFANNLLQSLQQNPQVWQSYIIDTLGRVSALKIQAEEARRDSHTYRSYNIQLTADLESEERRTARLSERLAQANNTAGAAVSNQRMIKIADPDRFDGSRAELRAFKAAVENKIMGNAPLFPSIGSELAYIFGLLKGRAQDQVEAQRLPDGTLPFEKRQDMLRVLDQAFGDPDEKGTAQRRLRDIRQANRSFSDFYAEFQRYAPLSGFNAEALKSALEKGLSAELSTLLNTVDTEALTLEDFATKCQQIDNRMRRSNSRPAPARPFAFAPATAPPAVPTSAARPLPPGDPMDLSAVQFRGPLTDQEKARRRAENLCLYCGGPGHQARFCRLRTQTRLAASEVAEVNPKNP